MKKTEVIAKCIGVWMDHAEARLNEYGKNDIRVVHSTHVTNLRVAGESGDGMRLGNNRSTNNEYSKHHQEQDETHKYFHQLVEALKPYDEIFLFGPTTARKEFQNFLHEKKLLHGKKVVSKTADYMSEPEMIAKVKEFFAAEAN